MRPRQRPARLQPQTWRAITYASTVVITIVLVTAMPYAAASALEERKRARCAIVAIISAQFTSGM